MARSFNAVHHILIGFLAEALHLCDNFLIAIEPEQIRIFMDKSLIYHFLQSCFGESVDVQGITADKQGIRLNLLRRAFLIGAIQGLYFIHLTDLGGLSADRTDLRDLHVVTAGQILRDLRDDHIRLINRNMISDPQSQGTQYADIVHRGTADCGALEFYRFEDCHWIDQPGATGAPFDLF